MGKKIIIGILALIILAQLFQPSRNNGEADGPQDITHVADVPDGVLSLLKSACYDCHSNHTSYPWYGKITPVNWWLQNHVDEGKSQLNFSIFSTYSQKKMDKKLDEIIGTVKERYMPMESYVRMHSEADLSDDQCKLITSWALQAKQQIANRAASVE